MPSLSRIGNIFLSFTLATHASILISVAPCSHFAIILADVAIRDPGAHAQ